MPTFSGPTEAHSGVPLLLGPSGFHVRATSFVECADSLSQGKRPWLVVQAFLYARATELALKAFLLAKGNTIMDAKKLGHDLEKLLKRAKELGLDQMVPPRKGDADLFRRLNEYYCDKRLEYFELESAWQGFPGLPKSPALQDTVHRLLTGIVPLCRSAEATFPS